MYESLFSVAITIAVATFLRSFQLWELHSGTALDHWQQTLFVPPMQLHVGVFGGCCVSLPWAHHDRVNTWLRSHISRILSSCLPVVPAWVGCMDSAIGGCNGAGRLLYSSKQYMRAGRQISGLCGRCYIIIYLPGTPWLFWSDDLAWAVGKQYLLGCMFGRLPPP